MRGLADDLLQQRHFLPIVGPFEAHRLGAVAGGDRLGAVFVALRADVLGRVAAADDQYVLALELHGVAEIVAVQDAAVECRKTFEIGHVGHRKMPRRDDDVVEFLGIGDVVGAVMRGDGEFLRLVRKRHHAHRAVEAHPFLHAGLFDAALDVVPQHGARRVGADRPPKVLLERVVGEFQAFLRPVRPEVAIHRAMHRVAMLVEAGAPGVVPQAAPVGLFFEADDFRDVGALVGGRLEGPELRQAGRPGPDDGHAFFHFSTPPVCFPGRKKFHWQDRNCSSRTVNKPCSKTTPPGAFAMRRANSRRGNSRRVQLECRPTK